MKVVCWPACSARSFERDAPSWQAWSTLQLPLCPEGWPRRMDRTAGLCEAQDSSTWSKAGGKGMAGWGAGVLHNGILLGRPYEENKFLSQAELVQLV